MGEKKKQISGHVNSLIVLCHILNDYDEFTRNLSKLIKTKDNRDIVNKLYKISKGQDVTGSKKIKKFYRDNKSVIDTINKFSSITEFISYNYDWEGNLREKYDLDFFYKYIMSHKENLREILSLLEKIKSLDFGSFQFDEETDFTNNQYEAYMKFNNNFRISYLDNMKAVPNYQSDVVEYITTGSNYEIVAGVSSDELSDFIQIITVNSLLFDSERLPENITKDCIFNEIINLKKQQEANCDNIRNSVDLSVAIDDLYSQFGSTSRIIESLKNVESKEQLHEVLLGIKSYLDQLQIISSKYDDNLSKNDSLITKEKLQEEKRLYLERRYLNSIDID